MKSALMIIAQNVFRDEEYEIPHQILTRRGAHVVTASETAGEALGKLGMRVHAETSVADAARREWDAVVFVGGAGAAAFFDDPAAHAIALSARDRDAVVSAICIAPSTLAHAGMLQGVEATAFPSQSEDLVIHGARWTGDPVTVDGLIVTANGPEAAEQFGHAVADLMGLPEEGCAR